MAAKFKPWLPPKNLVLFEQNWAVNADAKIGDDGECIPNSCQINLGAHLCDETKGETFFHELIHALCSLTGMTNRMDDSVEEDLCRSLGPALYAAMKRNRLSFE